MTTPPYVVPPPESLSFSGVPERRDSAVDEMSPAQEINERRARVENAELLRNLRSL